MIFFFITTNPLSKPAANLGRNPLPAKLNRLKTPLKT
jgi:hypothetical protein